jgi:hypothetical protein
LGIGTSSPSAKLQVGATTDSSNVAKVTVSSSGLGYLGVDSSGTNGVYLIANNSGSTQTGVVTGGLGLVGQGAYPLIFGTNSTERMRLDSSGNLGLGVTPSAWWSSRKAFQFGTTGSIASGSGSTLIGDNYYTDNTPANLYLTTGFATAYQQTTGEHRWLTAASGTAGNSISFTQAMTLDASGNLGVGTTSPAQKLDLGGGGQLFFSSGAAGNLISNNNYVNFGQLFSSGGPYMGYGAKGSTSVASGYVSATTVGIGRAAIDLGADGTGNFRVFTGSGETTAVGSPLVNMVERARIDSSGNLLVGTTSASGIITTSANVNSQAGTIYTRNINASSGSYSGLTVGNNLGPNYAGFILASSGQSSSGFLAANSVYAYAGAGQMAIVTEAAYPLIFGTSGTERVRIDSSGNLLVGTTSTIYFSRFSVAYAGNAQNGPTFADNRAFGINRGGSIYFAGQYNTAGDYRPFGGLFAGKENATDGNSAGYLTFRTNDNGTDTTERARISSNGFSHFLGSATAYFNTAGNWHSVESTTSDDTFLVFNNNASPYGVQCYFWGASPNNGTNYFYSALDTTATRFRVYSNGGIANYSANNSNLSDRREKKNLAPAGSYLDKICAIPVQTFNYIDQNLEEDGGLTLGVVAQDVQAVAPELVMESNWASKDQEPKMRLSIYQTDLQYALMKCIQEQQAIIESLKARLDAANL